MTLLSPWQPAQPLAALLTRTNTTTAFCRLYKAPKGILLPSASTTKQWAASRISAGSGRGAADTGRTCCTTGHRGAPDMAAALPFRPTFPRESKAEPVSEARGLRGSAEAGWEGSVLWRLLELVRSQWRCTGYRPVKASEKAGRKMSCQKHCLSSGTRVHLLVARNDV